MDTVILPLAPYRERQQWEGFRGRAHGALDEFLDRLEAEMTEPESPAPTLMDLTAAIGRQRAGLTGALAAAVRKALPHYAEEERELSVRRVFQALRIAVNDEFSALDSLLRRLPECLNPGGRVAVLTFHSGEDRRVKKAFAAGLAAGDYVEIAAEVVRAGPAERRDNPRSTSAKLRWARRAG